MIRYNMLEDGFNIKKWKDLTNNEPSECWTIVRDIAEAALDAPYVDAASWYKSIPRAI